MHQNEVQLRTQSMEKDYKKLFQGLESPALPSGLYQSVLNEISLAERRVSQVRLAVFVPLVLISSFAVFASFQYLAGETAQSGLSEYLSILFSDGGTVLSYWKEFLISLAETAPVFGTALFLGAIWALMVSIKSALKNTQIALRPFQLTN